MALERTSKRTQMAVVRAYGGQTTVVDATAPLVEREQSNRERHLARQYRVDMAVTEGMARKRQFADERMMALAERVTSEYQGTRDAFDAIAERPMTREARMDVVAFGSDILTLIEDALKDGFARTGRVMNDVATRDLTPPQMDETTYRTRSLTVKEWFTGKVTEKA